MELTLDLIDYDREPTRIEVVIRRDTVELHHRHRLVGSTDRDLLRDYITTPFGTLTYDDTQWTEHDSTVWLNITDRLSQPLTEPQLADLRSKL